MPPYVLKPKTENKNTLYITPCLNVTLCIKTKNRKQKRNARLYDRNRKNVKAVYKLKKINNQNQNSLRFFSREFIVPVSFSISTTFRSRSSIILFASIA